MPNSGTDLPAGNSPLAHMVYFSLKDPSPDNRQKMLASCQKHLTGHAGVLFFAAGVCSDYKRSVNDRDFDIALHLVFVDHAAHDAYQVAPRHRQFVDECQTMWSKVRVFDADLTALERTTQPA